MQFTSLKNTLGVVFLGVILAGCANEPQPVVKSVISTPVYQIQSQPVENDACCYHPSEIVKYQNKPVADCAKSVEVIRYKNTCHDCAYPVVIRSDSLCTSSK
jgi:hypothetical protein